MDRQQILVMAMGAAHRAHQDFHVDPTARIDVFGTLASINAYAFFRPLKSMFGAYVPMGGPAVGLLINSNLPLSVQRFTAAHELGHLYLKHRTISLDAAVAFTPEERARLSEEETAAETFAAFFLMPKPLVTRAMRDLDVQAHQLAPPVVYLLALRMGASYRATVNQLQTLKFISASTAAKFREVTPKEIKSALNDDDPIGRRDVWVLNERWNGKEIFPGPNDVIKIQLQETPTSGYTWLMAEKTHDFKLLEDNYWDETEEEIGGSCTHEFVASLEQDAQKTRLRLHKKRPWEDPGAASAQFEIDVNPQLVRRTGPLVLPKLA
jgi:Zn-dependent peptidase ImmA (M78 family)/predicted secreted protein